MKKSVQPKKDKFEKQLMVVKIVYVMDLKQKIRKNHVQNPKKYFKK